MRLLQRLRKVFLIATLLLSGARGEGPVAGARKRREFPDKSITLLETLPV
jgi:hypothetical protein